MSRLLQGLEAENPPGVTDFSAPLVWKMRDAGKWDVWQIENAAGEIVGAVVTAITTNPTGKMLEVMAIAGEDKLAWIPQLDRVADQIAREQSCSRIMLHSNRPIGRWRVLKKLGYEWIETTVIRKVPGKNEQ